MPLAAIALGSNLPSRFGDREANLREAIARISQLGRVQAVSTFYDTAPVGYTEQPRFLNAALLVDTSIPPIALMQALLEIERAMGRVRDGLVGLSSAAPHSAPLKGPRIVDIDLLLVSGVTLNTPMLRLPHPELSNRRFVLEPLAEIAPELVHPTSKLTIRELLANLER